MNPGTSAIATAVIVILGKWSKGEKLELRLIIAAGFLAMLLALLNEAEPKLASKMALLIMVTAGLVYGVPVAQRVIGITGNRAKQGHR